MLEENKTLITPEGYQITFYDHESVEVNLSISKDIFEVIKQIARKKDLSIESVIKFFIGKGLRDLEPELATKLVHQRFKSRKGAKEKREADLAGNLL